jgi:hypothetical protein
MIAGTHQESENALQRRALAARRHSERKGLIVVETAPLPPGFPPPVEPPAAATPAMDSSAAHRDNNMRAAFIHVMADAAVSVLAILGLAAGKFFGWVFTDPVMGIIGALVIANWSYGLIRDTGAILLDMNPDRRLADDLRKTIESEGDRLADLHLWRLGLSAPLFPSSPANGVVRISIVPGWGIFACCPTALLKCCLANRHDWRARNGQLWRNRNRRGSEAIRPPLPRILQ